MTNNVSFSQPTTAEDLTNSFRIPQSFVGSVEEWRVMGDAGPDFPPYDFTWRGPEAERKARSFIALDGVQRSISDLKLSHRVVTYGEWFAAVVSSAPSTESESK